jgi:hypothetical protein
LVEAVVTLVAAEATVRGVTAVRRADVVRPAPAVLAGVDLVAAEVFAALVELAVRVRELARTPFATRT